MKTSEVLKKAADLIQERGWADGNADPEMAWGETGDSTPLCLEGGIIAALSRREVDIATVHACPAYQAVHAYLNMTPAQRLYDFNDARERTAFEVIEVLRAAALIEAARERADVYVVSAS